MASPYARKVDQQLFYLRQILDALVAQSDTSVSPAFIQAGYLQLEMALRFYVFELTDKSGKGNQQLGMLDAALIEQLAASTPADAPSQELVELADVARQSRSWLAVFLQQLGELKRVDLSNKLRGAIFQTEEVNPVENLIASTSISPALAIANFDDLNTAASAFQQLVIRQRAVSEEF